MSNISKQSHRVNAKQRDALLRDLISGERDLLTLAAEHDLQPDALADWVQDEGNRHCLTGLCVLADLQTQVLLSRYRLLAATRLIRLATSEEGDDKAARDTARRACVDLLKLDLKRAEHTGFPVADDAEEADPAAAGLAWLEQAVRGEPDTSNH